MKALDILDWIGILCGVYVFLKLIQLGLPIMKEEVKKFLK